MRSVHAVWGAVVLLLAACQSANTPEYTGWIGHKPDAPEVSLDDYEAPKKLGVFRLQGEMDFPDRKMRMFRYQNRDNADDKIDVALYPLPAGWSDMASERAVAGHYGTVKQDMAERLVQRNGSTVEAISEEMRSVDGVKAPIAEGVFREIAEKWTRTLVLQLGMRDPVFVRVTADYPEETNGDRIKQIRAATEAFLARDEHFSPDGNE